MIKCFGFGKLLKQLFIIGLISCFGLLANSFVNASYYNFGDFFPEFGNNNCNIGLNLGISCSKSSYLLTSYDSGYMKTVNSLFWTSDGIGFYYKGQSQTFQGLIYTGFYICSGDFTDFNTGTFYLTPDCTNKFFIGSYENLKNKLLSKTPLYVGTLFPNGYGIVLSLVYDDFYFTVSLGGGNDSYPNNGIYLLKDMGVSGQDYDTLTFGSNVLYEPGGQIIPSGNGTVGDNVNGNIQGFSSGGNIIYQCTNKKALEYYNSVGLSKNLCFGGLDNYNTGNLTIPTPGTGKDILDIWAETALINGETYGYEEWFSYYRNAYNNLNMVALSNPFTGKPDVLQSLFRMIDTYGASVSDRVIIEYCDLLLYKSLTGTYNGILGNEPCSVNGQNSIDYYYNYGSGYTTIIGNNVFDGTGEVITDGSVFMETFINKLKTQFVIDRSDTGLGVIPRYIISFMVLLALFRFISH